MNFYNFFSPLPHFLIGIFVKINIQDSQYRNAIGNQRLINYANLKNAQSQKYIPLNAKVFAINNKKKENLPFSFFVLFKDLNGHNITFFFFD